ncbi:MAG: 2-C-methyl-D-erythritol 4-phosphate cytidylyltransferase [Epulopiscium sp.]|nr:2-C-methyl-D-erythritol 4-phosphate cytidylyltransferase [Candidatus Epulonipiscium sp.]
MRITVIIAAAGQGKRMQAGINKQYLKMRNKPILAYTIEVFEKIKEIQEIILVVAEGEEKFCAEAIRPYGFKKVTKFVLGGKERQDSIYEGLKALSKETDIVLIHDGARPFVQVEEIKEAIQIAAIEGASVLGVPVKDTIKVVDSQRVITSTPDRGQLWIAQTPQIFQYELIKKAYSKARDDGYIGTDDASLVERIGHPVKMIEGKYSNIKITTPEDLILGEAILHLHQQL